MTEAEAAFLVRRIYWLALGFGSIGFVIYFGWEGWRQAAAFALGALGSVGNLWLFEKLTRSIEPAPAGKPPKKPWQAGIFIVRYIVLLAVGYAIVKALGVNALAVIFGLLTSTAAVVAATALELLQELFVSRSSH
jgi:hypothetical protein